MRGDAHAPDVVAAVRRPALPLTPVDVRGILEHGEVVDSKPGQRVTFRRAPVDGTAIYAKCYSNADLARRSWANHCALWRAGLSVPEPLAFDEASSMVVYAPAEGQSLHTLLSAPLAARHALAAGRWLARLHSTPVALGRRFDLPVESANLELWAAQVGTCHPPVAERAATLARGAARSAARLGLRADAAIHKDFHPAHVVVGSEIVVIDLDEARLGDPAFDVGHFGAYVELARWRDEAVVPGEVRSSLLLGYESVAQRPAEAALRWAEAYSFVKISRQLVLDVQPGGPAGDQRNRLIELCITAGEASLDSVSGFTR